MTAPKHYAKTPKYRLKWSDKHRDFANLPDLLAYLRDVIAQGTKKIEIELLNRER